jgi:GGDEF domain-containing protein
LSVGYSHDDVEVQGAEASGTRAHVVPSSSSSDSDARPWLARGVGRVHLNGVPLAKARLKTGDHLRVVDTYFRFLCGNDIDSQYYEAIYHLTIVDFPTGLHNARYLHEVLEKELARSLAQGSALAVATVQVEGTDGRVMASHDILGSAASTLRRHVSRERVVARSNDLEIVVVCPGAGCEQVEEELTAVLQPVLADGKRVRLGVAASRSGLCHRELLVESRANTRPLSV